ncbi:MAG: DUF4136 domain-containing protein [candidate division Zixibacteria bacterium]
MKSRTLAVVAMLLMGLTVLAGTKVRTDFDQNASFGHLRTYSRVDHDTDDNVDPALAGSLVNDRIIEEIDIKLANLGYQKVENAEADFLVAYSLSSELKTKVKYFGSFDAYGHGYRYGHYRYRPFYGRSYGHGGSGYASSPVVYEYLSVTLIMDVIEARTDEVIWRGWAIKSLEQYPKPKHVSKFITKSVDKLLKKFPPEKPNT